MSNESPQFQSVRREKFSQQISRQLMRAVIGGHYKAGDRLPPERELATMFGASRSAVREAVGLLVAKNIATVEQGRGTTINRPDEWNTLDPELFMLQYGELAFEQLIEARSIFEPAMAALAAEHITPATLDVLRSLTQPFLDDSVEDHVAKDTSFHLEIAKATQNTVLLIVMTSINDLLRESRRRTFVVPGELEHSWRCHQAILDAFERRDAQAAGAAMTEHMEQVRKAMARYRTLAGQGAGN